MGSSQSSLHEAAERGDPKLVQQALDEDKEEDQTEKEYIESDLDSEGKNALHVACIHGHTNLVKLFITKYNVDHEIKSEAHGQTALAYAADNNHIQTVSFLVTGGVRSVDDHDHRENEKPTSTRKDNLSTSSSSLSFTPSNIEARDRFGKTPLVLAAFRNFLDIVLLLLKHGAHIDSPDDRGHTALSVACMRGHMLTAHALIQKGADADSADLEGYTPLMHACSAGHKGIVNLLLYEAKITNINATTYSEKTSALMFAVSKGAADIVRALLDNFADTDLKNIHGFDAARIASLNKNRTIMSMIQNHSEKRSKKTATEHFRQVHVIDEAQKLEDKEQDDAIRKLLHKIDGDGENEENSNNNDDDDTDKGKKRNGETEIEKERREDYQDLRSSYYYTKDYEVSSTTTTKNVSEHVLVAVGQSPTTTASKKFPKPDVLREHELVEPLLQDDEGRDNHHVALDVKPSPPKNKN